ncbi:hypothetical protein Tco_0225367, partial [Tanacetum coccineum]
DVKRILRYVKGTLDVALCFGDLDLTITGYVDSDYAVVAMSTTEAEYVAAAQAVKEAVWLKMLLEEHIRVQYHFVREKVEEGTVDMRKIHTDDNVAAYLTKAINCDKFIWCRSSCGLAERKQHGSARKDNGVNIDWASIESSSGRLSDLKRQMAFGKYAL